MTQEALAAECFGGSFKAANAKDSKLPENRKVHVKVDYAVVANAKDESVVPRDGCIKIVNKDDHD